MTHDEQIRNTPADALFEAIRKDDTVKMISVNPYANECVIPLWRIEQIFKEHGYSAGDADCVMEEVMDDTPYDKGTVYANCGSEINFCPVCGGALEGKCL